MIRKATVADVEEIHRILKEHADRGELLPRALSDLYDDLRDFSVFEEKSGGPIIGVCALHVCWEDLAEIRSLAVSEQYQGEGIGSALVTAALAEAQGLEIRRRFTQKVWTECIKCVKFPDCDEIAMLKLLSAG
jgi:amino-acid N-acetyltransferase